MSQREIMCPHCQARIGLRAVVTPGVKDIVAELIEPPAGSGGGDRDRDLLDEILNGEGSNGDEKVDGEETD